MNFKNFFNVGTPALTALVLCAGCSSSGGTASGQEASLFGSKASLPERSMSATAPMAALPPSANGMTMVDQTSSGPVSLPYGGALAGLSDSFGFNFNPNDVLTPVYYVHASVSPAPVSGNMSSGFACSGAYVCFQFAQAPNTTYTVTVTNAKHSNGGPERGGAFTFKSANTNLPPQAPVGARSTFQIGTLQDSCPRTNSQTFCAKIPQTGQIDPTLLSDLVISKINNVRYGPSPTEIDSNCTPAGFHYGNNDPLLASLANKNINVLWVMDVANPPSCGAPSNPPSRPWYATTALYGQYCGQVAAHIAASNLNIHDVETGTNEPDFASNGGQFPSDGVAMAGYLKSCYSAIKAVAPNLRVFAPGVATGGGTAVGFLTYVHHLYQNGCRTGICWDVLTLHNYAWGADPAAPYVPGDIALGKNESKQTWTLYKDLQNQAVADGDKTPPVGLTESGFSSCSSGVSPDLKAYRTSVLLNRLLADPTVVQFTIAEVLQSQPDGSGFSCIYIENNDGTAHDKTLGVIQQFSAAVLK